MRQQTQSMADTQLRTALENMRYKSCTEADIKFLQTRIAGKSDSKPKLYDSRFRHVSLITARNIHRDKVNLLGARQFADDIGETLTEFCSLDKWKNSHGSRSKKHRRTQKTVHASDIIPDETKRILWNMPHNDSSHVAGKLYLCKGMPVLIKKNIATECCVTNGAEARVVSWHHNEINGVNILESLFVELINPPTRVQLDGLPPNVVPIIRDSVEIECKMPNDTVERIVRQQVPILPNFAMTDYASQGRTRPNNVVDLNNCLNHQSYYTCLSRSASADGTISVQGFDPKKIMGGASGYLRQEFRELEILDHITDLRYHGTLPSHITGHRRNTLVRAYQNWKKSRCPPNIHPAIKWDATNPFPLIEESKSDVYAAGNTSKNITSASTTHTETQIVSTKETQPNDLPPVALAPQGFIWSSAYSCAYDALLTIIYNLWKENPRKWTSRLKLNDHMKSVVEGFNDISNGQSSMEQCRDRLQARMHNID
ncbi:hypothetical protein OE88DRAFT_1711381 [Heliocybe sulcata]|uniref:Uncharacterized protein n=1 Tax=Heliocybe sulcata TaxID=5364 RepID=A0A5C3N7I8_9AGAM|nr:hypothetical protein OE88DRAFT_1711381 [Heliocybe sulcata]